VGFSHIFNLVIVIIIKWVLSACQENAKSLQLQKKVAYIIAFCLSNSI